MNHVPYLTIFRGFPVHLFFCLSLLSFFYLLPSLKVSFSQTEVCIAQELLVHIVSLNFIGLQKGLEHRLVEVVVIVDLTIMLIMNITSFLSQYSVYVTLYLTPLNQLLLRLLILHKLVHLLDYGCIES